MSDARASFPRRLASEALGTALLVAVGTGAVMTNAIAPGSLGLTGIALAWAFLITGLIAGLGTISGAHVNPAVTIALAISGVTPPREVAGYIVAQCTGAALGSATLAALLGDHAFLGATRLSIGMGPGFGVEFLLSFTLMLVIDGVSRAEEWKGGIAGIAIGGTVGLCVLVGGPLTGASMNPARSFGPALVGGQWAAHWLYWAAPIAGMATAVIVARLLRAR